MKRNEYHPFVRGKPNPIVYQTIYKEGDYLWKATDSGVYDIHEESLPRGAPEWKTAPMNQRSITQSEEYSKTYSTAGRCALIVGDYLPRGEPQGLKNCKSSQEGIICMSKVVKNTCRAPNDCFREIFGKGGIIHTF